MLFIQKIRYKNILSSGNQFTEVDFNSVKTTLIKGNSGQGKSLIITALIFGLYGKSNRGTTKKQLVNTINKKDCLVEIEFSVNKKSYKVRRGISPNIFEIYIDNKLQEELSAIKDQQKYLEQNILNMSFKTFMQVVILGSNNYIPFMQLSTSERRDLVEEILDIKIFSLMNLLLKDKIKSVEKKLKEIEFNKSSIENKLEMQKNFIQKIKNDGLKFISRKQEQIQLASDEIQNFNIELDLLLNNLQENHNEMMNISFSPKKLKGLLGLTGKVEEQQNLLNEKVNFFKTHSNCPTCNQKLQVEFKENKIKEIENKLSKIFIDYEELLSTIQTEEELEKKYNSLNRTIQGINIKITELKSKIKNSNKIIEDLNLEIKDIDFKIKNQNEEEQTYNSLLKTKSKLDKDYLKCKEALYYFEFSQLLMKDTGVKSKIIEKYLPIINNQINKYLQMMDLYINFSLNEEFKENINTPIHEGFSYTSFSEGEKQRINLATILAWREVSKLKNSVNCNLIFFDETLDSSLDASGIEDFLKIINYVVKDSNIFVISHREGFDDKFNKVLEVKKINGFSKIID